MNWHMVSYRLNPYIWFCLITGRFMRPIIHIKNINAWLVEELHRKNISGIIFDVDNTLVVHDGEIVRDEVRSAFEELKKNFNCVLFSNCQEDRHITLENLFGLPVVPLNYKKPQKDGFIAAAKIAGVSAKQMAMIGDRLLTDILGANRAGFISILVDPFSAPEPASVSFIRRIERWRYSKLKI